MMNLLALDTSSQQALLALATRDGLRASTRSDPAIRHGRSLIPMIRDLLAAHSLRVADLDLLAVGLGPGSFTGLRIGLTAARTLAHAISRPLIGLDSLELLAQNAPSSATHVAVLADAQRGELYLAEFTRPSPGQPLSRHTTTRFVAISAWHLTLPPETYVMGPSLDRLRPHFPPRLQAAEAASNLAQPDAILNLALRLHEGNKPIDSASLEPFYLRQSAAEEKWRNQKSAPPGSPLSSSSSETDSP